MTSTYTRYGFDTSDWFDVHVENGATVTFRASKYGSNHDAGVAALKAADMLRAAGLSVTVTSSIFWWSEEADRSRPAYKAA